MITVRVTTACGESWITGINATLDEAKNHYMGHRFERLVPAKNWCGVREVLLEPVIKVELIGPLPA